MNMYDEMMIKGLNKIKSLNRIKSIALRTHTKDFSDWFGDDRYYLRAEDIDGKVVEIGFPSLYGVDSPFHADNYKGLSDSDKYHLENAYKCEQVSVVLAVILLSRAYVERGLNLDIEGNAADLHDLVSIAALGRKIAPYDGEHVIESSKAERILQMETYWRDTII